jgi:salicylate 5-hydroxylase small subunit
VIVSKSQIAPATSVFNFNALLAEYAAALDERRYDDWVQLFAPNGRYKLQPRENFDRDLPLCTLAFESQGMLKDRIYSIEQTLFHAPYYQRHVISVARVLAVNKAQANYAVFRTKANAQSEVFNVGRYLVTVDEVSGLISELHAIFDSEMIANSIIYPI